MTVTVRDLRRGEDIDRVAELWHESLAPEWPVLPEGLDVLLDGYVAEHDGQLVGIVATDSAGSVPFLAVAPSHRRRGLATELVDRAVADLRRAGRTRITAGRGGQDYIWPGVPHDCHAALAFFPARGWVEDGVTTDLVQDLSQPGIDERLGDFDPPTAAGIDISLVDPGNRDEVDAALAFEDTHFPEWSAAFHQTGHDILVVRHHQGVLGSLLLAGPGRVSTYWPLLGDDCATIACVGVAPDQQGRGLGTAMVAAASRLLAGRGAHTCLIDQVVRVDFYARLGYRPWRTYSMRTLRL